MAAKQKPTAEPTTLGLRDRLKLLMDRELDGMPELLDQLNSKQRLDVILRLMPLIMPKTQSVHHRANEPTEWGSNL